MHRSVFGKRGKLSCQRLRNLSIYSPLLYRGKVGYPSGQRGQTVNLMAYAFTGSNPVPTIISILSR